MTYEDGEIKTFEFPFIERYYSYIIILPQNRKCIYNIEKFLSYQIYISLLSKLKDRNFAVRIVDTKMTTLYKLNGLLKMLEIPQLNGNIIYQRNNINIYGGEPSRAVDTEWTFLGILGGSDKDRQEMIKTANVNRSFSPTHPFIYFIVDNRSGAIMFMGRFAGNEK